jgi:drug/metabolite transporter (DMT)-like permease
LRPNGQDWAALVSAARRAIRTRSRSAIGRFFLHERLTAFRIIACCVVAIGAIFISHDGHARHVKAPGRPVDVAH